MATSLSADQRSAIESARSFETSTRRATVASLEEIMFRALPVLDHGFVRVVDYMGDDAAVVQAARVSYGRGTRKVNEDRGLIRYLMRHSHTTPFEMPVIKLHVKLPIFVARQWIRHRTASINEYSARYSILDREFYLPDPSHLGEQSQSNRQGRGQPLAAADASQIVEMLRSDAERNYDHYVWMLNETDTGAPATSDRPGLARELARMNLTLNTYTQWYWKIDLHNLMHFLRLRADPHAQSEIRAYADVILSIMALWVPNCYEAFIDYRMKALTLSRSAVEAISRILRGETIEEIPPGLSAREWSDVRQALGLPDIIGSKGTSSLKEGI